MDFPHVVGLVGGILAIFKLAWDTVQWWRNRGRIEVEIVRVEHFLERYPAGTGPAHASYGPPGGSFTGDPLDGKSKNAFSILEFEIRNSYKHPVTVGRIEVDDWIFSDWYRVPMYGPSQDYRVFDLYTREGVGLAPYHNLAPGQTLGRRVEIVERAVGPEYPTMRTRTCIPERAAFILRVVTTEGSVTKTIPVSDSHQWSPGFDSHQWSIYDGGIARWSREDLLKGQPNGSGGEPRP